MKQPMELDRRRFLQLAGTACLLSMADGPVAWSPERTNTARFAYIGLEQAIHQYSISQRGRFVLQQTMASARPVAMAISGGHLYVANGVSQHGNLARGSVEAYTINATTGQLAWKSRVPLSLSATSPTDLAVAPNGRSIVVAVHGGGAYNLLLLEEDGSLGRVTGILKEIGAGPHPLQDAAHPSAVKFDRAGRVLTADQGNDKLSVLTLSNGGLSVAGRCEVTPGSGPGCLVLHPDGRRVYVGHTLDGAVSSYSYSAAGILEHKQTVGTSVMGGGAGDPSCRRDAFQFAWGCSAGVEDSSERIGALARTGRSSCHQAACNRRWRHFIGLKQRCGIELEDRRRDRVARHPGQSRIALRANQYRNLLMRRSKRGFGFRGNAGKETVMDAPSLCFARHDVNTDKPLRANRLWRRPKEKLRDRRIRSLFYSQAMFRVFKGEIEIRNFVGKARHVAARVMVGLRLRDPFDRCAIDLNRVRKRLGWCRNEGKMNLHAGPGRVVIKHEEVVIVDRCIERLGANVLQAMG